MRFIRPEYIFRPAQILRRLAWGLGMTKKAGSAMAPWGLTLRFDPDEVHGRAMLALGLSDLRVNEMIARIVRKGDIAVDIGANIGIMASLMAARSGPSGFVYAFEPHPKIRETLQKNIAAWASAPVPTAPVSVIPMAVSYPYAGGEFFLSHTIFHPIQGWPDSKPTLTERLCPIMKCAFEPSTLTPGRARLTAFGWSRSMSRGTKIR